MKSILKWLAAAGIAGALAGLKGFVAAISSSAPVGVDAALALILTGLIAFGVNWIVSKLPVKS